ncbi:MAG: hypothetical protein RLZ94_245 [Actinomycetota bacterium]|jgi:lipopolysaccharide transport system permease protein
MSVNEALGLHVALWRHRRLVLELSRREVLERTAGQALGAVWSVIVPVVQISVYLFLFVVVLKARLTLAPPEGRDYASYILVGLVPWLALQDIVARSVVLGPANRSVLKQTVFPAEVLPAKSVCAALVPFAISMAGVVAVVGFRGGLDVGMLLLIPATVLLVGWMLTIAYVLSTAGVFVRDVKDVAALVMFVATYLAPIVYDPAAVPTAFRPIITVNPFSWILWCFQDAGFHGAVVHPWAWMASAAVAVAGPLLGHALFSRARPAFAECL